MLAFLNIMIHNIFPMLGLAGIGYWLDSKFRMDVKTLTKITFFFVLPSFVFRSVYSMKVTDQMIPLFMAGISLFILHAIVAFIVARVRDFDKGMHSAFLNATMFTNCGNVGVAMITLIFTSAPYVHDGVRPYYTGAMAAITVLLILTNTSLNTLGLFLAGHGRMTVRDSLLTIAHMPAIYVLAAALLCRNLELDVTSTFIWPIINYAAVALPLMAMLTLGIQLHRTTLFWFDPDVWLTVFTRLIGGPIFAFLIITLYGKFDPLTAQVFFIFSAVPSAVNSVMFAVEFDNYPGYATQSVMMSFVLSSITLSAVIFLARYLFPLPMW